MADTTTNYAFPYPEAADPPDGAGQMQDLAEAVDTALDGVDDRLDAAEATIVTHTSNIATNTSNIATNTSNISTDAARITAIEGRLTTTSATSAASATSGTTELAIDQVTASLVNGKVYRVVWNMNFGGSVNGDVFFVLLRFGSGTGGTQITFRSVAIGSSFGTDLVAYFTAGSTGSQTITGTVRRSSGTGTMTVSGSATQPRFLTIERMS